MSRVLYIGSGGFPYENARSMRMRSFCSLFSDLGYSVDVLSDWYSTSDEGGNFPWSCLVNRSKEEYRSIDFISRLRRYSRDLTQALERSTYDFAFVTEMPERVTAVQRLCRKVSLPIIGESCEWYDSSTWKYGALDPHNIAFQLAHSSAYKKWDSVICISSYLDRYYKGLGISSTVVPTILDTVNVRPRIESDAAERNINILFAGTFGGTKDGVTPIVSASLRMCASSARKIVVNLLGPSEGDAKKALGVGVYNRALEAGVLRILPRVPQEVMFDYWRWADYGTFIRPNRRSSEAGFPTKLGEGMSAGTPFITNRTGDIPKYVSSGRNGFLLKNNSEESCINLLEQLLTMGNDDHSILRKAARIDAECYFDYRRYSTCVNQLIKGAIA